MDINTKEIFNIISPFLSFAAGYFGGSWQKNKADSIATMQTTIEKMDEKLNKQREEIVELKSNASRARGLERIIQQYERDKHFLLEDLGIASWEADKDGNCVYANQIFQDLTGLSPEECKNVGWFDGIHESDRNKINHQWKRFVGNTDTQIGLQFRFVHKTTGKETNVTAHGQAIYGEGNEIYKYTARTKPLSSN